MKHHKFAVLPFNVIIGTIKFDFEYCNSCVLSAFDLLELALQYANILHEIFNLDLTLILNLQYFDLSSQFLNLEF